jgi:teichuronic acid biosynthesis glycosyltransferase TuaC
MKVAVVAEFYPRADDPVLGVWAHRQALAARDAGAEVRVVVLHRVIPPAATLRRGRVSEILRPLAQPRRAELDGLTVDYVRFASPPRGRSYGSWGAYAARPLRRALERLRAEFPFDLVHAHYAVPAADAVLRAGGDEPLVISEHGGDVFHTAPASAAGERNVRRAFGAARLVLANSAGTALRCEELGARATEVVHLGTDLPDPGEPVLHDHEPSIVTVGHLIARKRHADVIRALRSLRPRHPELRYRIVGEGPERDALARLAAELDVADRVELTGQLPPEEARAAAWSATLFAMPSIDEAFGVAYVEAMAGGVPAIGSRGEIGPEEIAALGRGLRLVPPGDVEALAAEIDAIVSEPAYRAELARAARDAVAANFTWEKCGASTLAAYERVLA